MTDFIDKVGLEVEGGWEGPKLVPPFDDLDLIADHSIDGTTLHRDKPMLSPHVGEAVSKPLPLAEVSPWIDKYWPTETNNTCGYHIHISLKNPLHYMLLTKKAYAILLYKQMNALGVERGFPKEHYLFKRLSGENPFCALSFDASGQINVREKRVGMRVRYGFLNFAKNIHGTVEFRALPTFDNKDDARAFTMHFINVTEDYIASELRRLPSMKRSLVLEESNGLHKIIRTKGDTTVCA